MNDVLEVLRIAKTKNEMVGKNRTMLEEKGIVLCSKLITIQQQ